MFRRVIVLVIAAAVIVSLLTGCGISEGQIIDKQYSPAHTTTTTQIQYNPATKSNMIIPIIKNEPDRWKFKLKNNDDTGWIYVSKIVYDKFEIGDYYNANNFHE